MFLVMIKTPYGVDIKLFRTLKKAKTDLEWSLFKLIEAEELIRIDNHYYTPDNKLVDFEKRDGFFVLFIRSRKEVYEGEIRELEVY